MRVTPKTEKQIAEENLWPEGEYSFEVIEAKDSVSKKGNEMIVLSLRLFDNDDADRSRTINDYLMDSIPAKLRQICVAGGLQGKYESGTILASDFIGICGTLKLKIQHDKTGQYAAQNSVGSYVVNKGDNDHGIPAGHPAGDAMPWEANP